MNHPAQAIFVVENDWRTRRFICTVLKYSANAIVIEASNPHDALAMARELECRIHLLIWNIDSAGAKPGVDIVRGIAAEDSSIRVLLISGRQIPPGDIPPACRFLSIPFTTAAFLNCVSQLCSSPATSPSLHGAASIQQSSLTMAC